MDWFENKNLLPRYAGGAARWSGFRPTAKDCRLNFAESQTMDARQMVFEN